MVLGTLSLWASVSPFVHWEDVTKQIVSDILVVANWDTCRLQPPGKQVSWKLTTAIGEDRADVGPKDGGEAMVTGSSEN